ncbi:MAG: ISKra4 family transposase [Candidatus Dadabacteria bacterium]|nr:ISKra4 family transposase [Candidatus Dadabacteria bacterium]
MECEARKTALMVMGKAIERRFNSDHSDKREGGEFCGCGEIAEYAGRRKKQFITVLGPMVLERAWYHCEGCNAGFSPRDRELGLLNDSLSPGVLRMVGISAAQSSFGEGSGLIKELGGVEVESKQVERNAKELGRDIALDEERRVQRGECAAKTCYMGIDGTGVPMRSKETEGRSGKQADGSSRSREAKLVVVWTAEKRDSEGRPVRDPGSVSYNAAIETVKREDGDFSPFARRVMRESERSGFGSAERQVVLGDGAAWIWNLCAELFPGAIEIVDIFHAKEHLCDVAKSLYGAGNDLCTQWAKERMDELDRGELDKIIKALRQHEHGHEKARKCINYINNNRHRMNYPEFRRMGFCVSTGVVEGGCKSIVGNRLKRGGMHWTVPGANAIIALKAAIMSNRFDSWWKHRRRAAS